MEIEITYDDYLNSSRKFMDTHNCPLATAMKRVLNRDLIVGTTQVCEPEGDKTIGTISPKFGIFDYDELRDNQTTFKTIYTPNEEVTESAGSLQHNDSMPEASN
jgi:hypothetical protein